MKVKIEEVEANIVRCPDEATAKFMIALIEKVREEGDSVGGVIECVVRNVPAGLGEPVFDKLEADLYGMDAQKKPEVLATVTGQAVSDEELDIWLARLTQSETETF